MNKQQTKQRGNYAFIDSQNLNLGIQKVGWKLNWRKFHEFLRDKYDVEKASMFIGYMPDNIELYEQMHELGYLIVLKPTLEMYKNPAGPGTKKAQAPSLDGVQGDDEERSKTYQQYGERVPESATQQSAKSAGSVGSYGVEQDSAARRAVKGNIDVDLTLYAVKEMPNYKQAIIVSGDGDFYSLIEFLKDRGKLMHIMAPNYQYSSLLKQFDEYIIRLDQHKTQLRYFSKKPKK